MNLDRLDARLRLIENEGAPQDANRRRLWWLALASLSWDDEARAELERRAAACAPIPDGDDLLGGPLT